MSMRFIPVTDFSPRTRTSPRSRKLQNQIHRTAVARHSRNGRQGHGARVRAQSRRPGHARQRRHRRGRQGSDQGREENWLSGDDQSGGRRWWSRNARSAQRIEPDHRVSQRADGSGESVRQSRGLHRETDRESASHRISDHGRQPRSRDSSRRTRLFDSTSQSKSDRGMPVAIS